MYLHGISGSLEQHHVMCIQGDGMVSFVFVKEVVCDVDDAGVFVVVALGK